ncbi:MAG TPA: hypothetical protein VF469_02565, partial [Kofleriaceae bacterium]
MVLTAASPAHAQGHKHGALAAAATAKVTDQAGERVTLDELVAAAVRRSPGLMIARADRDEGRDRNQAADAVDEWHLIGRFDAQDTMRDRTLASPSLPLDTRSASGEVGIERSLSTGGDITVATGTGQARYLYAGAVAGRGVADDIAVSGTTATARIEASQPLLRGAGED